MGQNDRLAVQGGLMNFRDRDGKDVVFPPDGNLKTRQGVFGILIADDRILLSWPQRWENRAELPGGGIDPGETEENALLREIYEETGLKINAPKARRALEKIVHYYSMEYNEFWVYTQRYDVLDVESYESLVFEGRRAAPENCTASWKRLDSLSPDNMQIFHFEALQSLKLIE